MASKTMGCSSAPWRLSLPRIWWNSAEFAEFGEVSSFEFLRLVFARPAAELKRPPFVAQHRSHDGGDRFQASASRPARTQQRSVRYATGVLSILPSRTPFGR